MQDPDTKPVERHWTSIDLGTEIYISSDQVAEWIVSDFDIVVPKLRMIHEQERKMPEQEYYSPAS